MDNFEIKVKTEDMVRIADDFKTKVNTMQTAVNDTEELLKATSSYWIGDGGNKKRKDFAERKKEAEEVIRRLTEYPGDLLKMAGIYVTAENENAERPAELPTDIIA